MHFKSCPISTIKVETTSLRIAGVLLTAWIIGYILTHNLLLFLPVLVEFLIRQFQKEYAPLMQIAKMIVRFLDLPQHYEDGAPKQFAMKLGLVFSLLIFMTAPVEPLSKGLSIVLTLCILLESLFGFCIGCVVYQQLMKWRR